MTPEKNQNLGTKINHSGNAPDGMREVPVNEFDNTPLQDAVDRGLVGTPDFIPAESNYAPRTDLETGSEKKRFTKKQKIIAALSGVALLAGIGGGVAASSMNGPDKSPVAEAPADPSLESGFPFPDDPNYDPFAKIGDNSNIAIADIDQLLGYFTSSDITREALTATLSQADQAEVDRIFEVIESYDSSDNVEVTDILNKYGLVTGEVPLDIMGHISEKSDFTEGELNELAFNSYPGIPFTDVRNALADFSQEEIDIARKVMDGQEHSSVLNSLLQSHGVEIPPGY